MADIALPTAYTKHKKPRRKFYGFSETGNSDDICSETSEFIENKDDMLRHKSGKDTDNFHQEEPKEKISETEKSIQSKNEEEDVTDDDENKDITDIESTHRGVKPKKNETYAKNPKSQEVKGDAGKISPSIDSSNSLDKDMNSDKSIDSSTEEGELDCSESQETEGDSKKEKSNSNDYSKQLTQTKDEQEFVESTVQSSNSSGESSEEDMSEKEWDADQSVDPEELVNSEDESSDFNAEESDVKRSRKRLKKKERNNRRKSARELKTEKKSSPLRRHAEKFRKRRMEELRVRNEELQIKQNKEDQERAEEIASRFDIDTDELRRKRIEGRLDLLKKLDLKRVQVIAGSSNGLSNGSTKENRENKEKDENERKTPSIISTSDSNSDSDSDSDVELEIIGKNSSEETRNKLQIGNEAADIKNQSSQSKASQILNQAQSSLTQSKKASTPKKVSWGAVRSKVQNSSEKSLSTRAALRTTLLLKQRKMGNMWLARELGYKTEQDHLRDCLKAEREKRVSVIKKEEERLRISERRQLRERMLLEQEGEDTDEELEVEDAEAKNTDNGEGEEDEELVLARKILLERKTSISSVVSGNERDGSSTNKSNDGKVEEVNQTQEEKKDLSTPDDNSNSDDEDTVVFSDSGIAMDDDATVDACLNDENEIVAKNSTKKVNDDETNEMPPVLEIPTKPSEEENSSMHKENSNISLASKKGEGERNVGTGNNTVVDQQEAEEKGNKPKNLGWKKMLEKEADKLKKLKRRKGSSLVEGEAEEEEEEITAGLEDFGFSLGRRKKENENEEEDADKLEDEDLKHVVDELSDDEGDEEEGDRARKEMMQREEKERHKEIMRRMREGYDGRRGGIAGGGATARGVHRFDQLVAADNRQDAKRLGLLNDDELESDDEKDDNANSEKKDSDEIEDESSLLDKMLKDRFLHRSSTEVEENFSEDDEAKDSADVKVLKNDEEAEELEKERLIAKRFARRARMQRLIEMHGEDKEFSQGRLIDEDDRMKEELTSMRDVGKLKRENSLSSNLMNSSSNSGGFSHHGSIGNSKSQNSRPRNLFLALRPLRHRKKRRRGDKEKFSAVHKNLSLGHVVFYATRSKAQEAAEAQEAAAKASLRRSNRKRKMTTSTSLWEKVAANGFRKKSRRV